MCWNKYKCLNCPWHTSSNHTSEYFFAPHSPLDSRLINIALISRDWPNFSRSPSPCRCKHKSICGSLAQAGHMPPGHVHSKLSGSHRPLLSLHLHPNCWDILCASIKFLGHGFIDRRWPGLWHVMLPYQLGCHITTSWGQYLSAGVLSGNPKATRQPGKGFVQCEDELLQSHSPDVSPYPSSFYFFFLFSLM